MKNRKLPRLLLTLLAILSVVAALLTVIPWPSATEVNPVGYKSLCSFSPASTAICLILANIFQGIKKKKFS